MSSYTHKTAPFYATSSTNTPQKVYFEIGVDSDNNEAKQEFLNHSTFYYERGKSDYLNISSDLYSDSYYQVYVVDAIYSTMTLDLKYRNGQTSTNVGTVYLKLMDYETGREAVGVSLDYNTKGSCLEPK